MVGRREAGRIDFGGGVWSQWLGGEMAWIEQGCVLLLGVSGERTLRAPGHPELRTRGVTGCEVRHLVGAGFSEGGAVGEARYVGFRCGAIAERAHFGYAQHIGHQQVGDSEAVGG